MKRWVLWSLVLLPPSVLATSAAPAQSAYLVSDLAPGNASGAAISPFGFYTAGNHFFFFGNLGFTGTYDPDQDQTATGIWVSDGTDAGTQPLAQVCVTTCTPRIVGTAGPLVFFLGEDEGINPILWRSDGTRAGTFPLTQEQQPSSNSPAGLGNSYALVGSRLFFTYNGELWRSDGTIAGTRSAGLLLNNFSSLTSFGGRLYFAAAMTSDGDYFLWRSDGTSAGTTPFTVVGPSLLTVAGSQLFFVAYANPQANAAQLWAVGAAGDPHALTQFTSAYAFFSYPQWLKPEGDKVYFLADDGIHGQQLWASDGTAAATAPVTGFTNSQPFIVHQTYPVETLTPQLLELAGGQLVFFATDGVHPPGLWATSGSPQSTVLLCSGACAPQDPTTQLVVAGSRVVFVSGASEGPYALWGSDGTAAGTAQLLEVCGAGCDPSPSLQQVGSQVFVTESGKLLWQTDGTAAGTKVYANGLLSQITGFALGENPVQVGGFGGLLLFAGLNLWTTDGTVTGTRQLTDMAAPASSFPSGLASLGSLVFFSASASGVQPTTLYQSAGTAATTLPVPGAPSPVGALVTVAGRVFFSAGNQLWCTDGTAAGTRQLADLIPAWMAAYQGELFFLGQSETGYALWKSDGTVDGTVQVGDLPAAVFVGSIPGEGNTIAGFWAVDGHLFFVAEDNSSFNSKLWRTDGTAAGTVELAAVPYQTDPQLTAAGGRVFFIGLQENRSHELSQTDGTAAGTVPVAGPQLGADGAPELSGLTALGNEIYFFVSSGEGTGDPVTLWRSDGTSAGTLAITSFSNDIDYSLSPPAVLGSQLLFEFSDGVDGAQLWASDGSAAGTRMLHDFSPGPPISARTTLTVAAGRAFFNTDDGVHGPEMWETDGTAAGTRLVQDIWPGPEGSNPSGMTQAGGLLFFSANDGQTGDELWALPLAGPAGCQASSTALCLLGGRFKVEAFWMAQGTSGQGQAVPLTPDTGTFWFFSPSNVEVVAKVIDGRALNDSFWFFYGALSNVEYWLTVTDTTTGLVRRYVNAAGQMASVGDTAAFGPMGAFAIGAPPAAPAAAQTPVVQDASRPAAEGAAAGSGGCQTTAAHLCLTGNRFAVTVSWQDFSGNKGSGKAVDLTSDTGYFWFFDASNVELVLKVLDGRAVNGKFWVFYGALSDVTYTITVRDAVTGNVRTYTNPAGQFASVGDTEAF